MWKFIGGIIVGTTIGVCLMCVLQINRLNKTDGEI